MKADHIVRKATLTITVLILAVAYATMHGLLRDEPAATPVTGFDEIPPLDHGIDSVGGEEGGWMATRVRAQGLFLRYGPCPVVLCRRN